MDKSGKAVRKKIEWWLWLWRGVFLKSDKLIFTLRLIQVLDTVVIILFTDLLKFLCGA